MAGQDAEKNQDWELKVRRDGEKKQKESEVKTDGGGGQAVRQIREKHMKAWKKRKETGRE